MKSLIQPSVSRQCQITLTEICTLTIKKHERAQSYHLYIMTRVKARLPKRTYVIGATVPAAGAGYRQLSKEAMSN